MNNQDDDKELFDALDRIANAPEGEVDDQVNKEVIRYWNNKVHNSKGEKEITINRAVRKVVLKDVFEQTEPSDFNPEYPEIERGTHLHNRQINKIGVVLEVQGCDVVVMTHDGKEIWRPENCDLIEDFD